MARGYEIKTDTVKEDYISPNFWRDLLKSARNKINLYAVQDISSIGFAWMIHERFRVFYLPLFEARFID